MRFASSSTVKEDTTAAIDEVIEGVGRQVTPGMVDLALVFLTLDYADDMEHILDRIRVGLPNALLCGCTAGGTIANGTETEHGPSIALLAASLPDVNVRPFCLTQSQLHGIETHLDWERIVGVAPESRPIFVALADPFRLDTTGFAEKLSESFPNSPLLGGVASAGREPEQNMLLLDGEVFREGVVGLALTGRISVDTVVSQGCRPVGTTFVITKGERNVISELGGKAPLARLQDVLAKLPPEDVSLAKRSLFVGRVIDEYKTEFSRGDFLIHNIMGADRKTGAIAIAGPARVGSTIQFHVRDAKSADEDLRAQLAPHRGTDVRGAMLFGCNGRGTNMWDEPDHDAGVLREVIGDVPVAGFFCGGEFGPVGGKNFVHGFTASIGLFRDPGPDP